MSVGLGCAYRVLTSENAIETKPPGGHDSGADVAGGPGESSRYEHRRVLGEGSNGVVFCAFDRETGQEVALKTLAEPDVEETARLKREFRVVADLAHPNLVDLYELHVEAEQCFFTMELLEASEFGDFAERFRSSDEGWSPSNLAEFERAVAQLLSGLAAIHGAGILHRDIKPSNVLVTRQGRVVLLDFGLFGRMEGRGLIAGAPSDDVAVVGTFEFMAPEQAWGKALSAAADVYAVGALVYRALTGRAHPRSLRSASSGQGARAKSSPGRVVEGIPEWLDRLVVEMLDPDPDSRPGLDVAIARLASEGGRALDSRSGYAQFLDGEHFVGRRDELETLNRLMVQEGPRIASIHGVSGVGKTALVGRFLASLSQEVLVLRGRCHPRESVPFNALDEIVDGMALSFASKRVDPPGQGVLAATAQLFPSLRPFSDGPEESSAGAFDRSEPTFSPEPYDVRRAGIEGLRETIEDLSTRQSLVLWIDDLQWADADSLVVLRTLVENPPGEVAMLLTFREEDRASSEVLAGLEASVELSPASAVDLGLAALPPVEAEELAKRWLDAAGVDAVWSQRLARESAGSPFLLGELTRALQSHQGETAGPTGDPLSIEGADVDSIVARRLESIPEHERSLLELISLAAGPISRDALLEAAMLGPAGRPVASALERHCMIRSSIDSSVLRLQPYHDRIADSVRASLTEDQLVVRHRRLAETIARSANPDPEFLVNHWLGAGESAAAGLSAVEAARRAESKLAFGRAAEFFEIALEHAPEQTDRHALRVNLAEALRNGGRGELAAQRFEEAASELLADDGTEGDVLSLKRRASEEFLCCGRFEQGMQIIHDIAPKLGLRIPESPAAAVRALLKQRVRITLRGLSLPPVSVPDPDVLRRMDAVFGTAKGVSLINPTLAAALHAQHLVQALDMGEPSRASQALVNEGAWCAIIGGRYFQRRAARAIEMSRELALSTKQPYDEAFFRMGNGARTWCLGEWTTCVEECKRAIEIYRSSCSGTTFEVSLTNVFLLSAMTMSGLVRETCERTKAEFQYAQDRGDLFAMTAATLAEQSAASLVVDEAPALLERCDELIRRWPTSEYLTQHYHYTLSTVQALVYLNRPQEAWARIASAWPQLKKARFLSLHGPRNLLLLTRGIAGLAFYRQGRDESVLRDVLASARRLGRESLPYSKGFSRILQGGIARVRQEEHAERSSLLQAAGEFDTAGMRLHSALARYRLAQIADSTSGEDANAGDWLAAEGVRRPERLAAAYGFTD